MTKDPQNLFKGQQPTLHRDDKDYCRAYDVCQRVGKLTRRDEMPLAPQLTLQAFEK
jgi:hypothetical protein